MFWVFFFFQLHQRGEKKEEPGRWWEAEHSLIRPLLAIPKLSGERLKSRQCLKSVFKKQITKTGRGFAPKLMWPRLRQHVGTLQEGRGIERIKRTKPKPQAGSGRAPQCLQNWVCASCNQISRRWWLAVDMIPSPTWHSYCCQLTLAPYFSHPCLITVSVSCL